MQSLSFVQNVLVSASRGKGIDRIALPPPLYGAASFGIGKPSRSSTFQPSAPSSSSSDPVPPTSKSGSYASDNHVIHYIYNIYINLYVKNVLCLVLLSGSNIIIYPFIRVFM